MRLFLKETGEELKSGDSVTTFKGKEVIIHQIYEPNTSGGGRGGKITFRDEIGLYNPSIIEAEFKE